MFSFGLFSSVIPFAVMITVYLIGLFTYGYHNFSNEESKNTEQLSSEENIQNYHKSNLTSSNTFDLRDYFLGNLTSASDTDTSPLCNKVFHTFKIRHSEVLQGMPLHVFSLPPPMQIG